MLLRRVTLCYMVLHVALSYYFYALLRCATRCSYHVLRFVIWLGLGQRGVACCFRHTPLLAQLNRIQ